jgi:Fe-S oxidoreductase
MRRNQVMIESEFPGELGVLFRNLENKGNPWGQNNSSRMDWAKDLPFEVPEFDGGLSPETEYLFFIGCAGAFDDNAKKTVRATAELLHIAGVDYVVLGKEESCTGDPARRSGNEFLFQMMAMQTKEMLDGVFEGREPGTRKIVTTCPHCMNTLGREYPQLDGHYEVVHHTQLLNQLVREKKLIPVAPESSPVPTAKLDINPTTNLQYHGPHSDGTERGLISADGHSTGGHPEDQAAPASEVVSANGNGSSSNGHAGPKTVTYHDPCYLGRHNEVYSPPRELVAAAGAVLKEMPRHADRALCCGAGGARMWMEENIGKRINMERVDEAISTEPDTIATGCPFCRVMLTDGLTERQSEAKAVGTEVMDVSQMLLAAVKRGTPSPGATPAGVDAETVAVSSVDAETSAVSEVDSETVAVSSVDAETSAVSEVDSETVAVPEVDGGSDPAPEAESDGPGDSDPSTTATSANVKNPSD